jgi:hypothetical protein
MPANRVYLRHSELLHFTCQVVLGSYALTQTVDNSFRRGDQFSGSSGSSEGSGTRTMSRSPESRWRVVRTWFSSMSVKVPGMASRSMIGVCSMFFFSLKNVLIQEDLVQDRQKERSRNISITFAGTYVFP